MFSIAIFQKKIVIIIHGCYAGQGTATMIFTPTTRSPSKTVAVFLDWYEPRFLTGIARLAKERNWALLFDYAQAHKWSAVPLRVDGLICLIGPDPKAADFLKKMRVPTVALTRSDEGLLEGCPRVLMDELACGRMAGEYFLSLGFENFLSVGKKGRTFFRERIQGFEEAVGKRAKIIETAWIGEALSHKSLRGPIEEALKKIPKPVAIFAPSDVTCVHVMRCAMELGLKIPEEVALLGVNNEELICDYAPVPLASIAVNFQKVGYEGALLLDKIMRGRKPAAPGRLIPPMGVVVRQSTNTIAVPEVRVAKALRFIWANLDRTLPVEEIAAHVGVAQPRLAALFAQHLHRTIVEEIARGRIEKARQLLTAGTLPAKQIASACGFSSPSYFNNVFHKATGMTPRTFRVSREKKERPKGN